MLKHRNNKTSWLRIALLQAFIAIFLVRLDTCNAIPLDNRGKEFILAFLTNSDPTDVQPINNRELHITGQLATTVTVEYPVGTNYTTAFVTPGDVTIVQLPLSVSEAWVENQVAANLLRVTAMEDIVVYQINRKTFSTDAALSLPVDVLGTEYIVVDYNSTLLPFFDAEFVVYAAYDGTMVQMQRTDTGDVTEVELNRGEGYMSTYAGSQTGVVVTSNRPVGVINGNQCTNIPYGVQTCDHIFEVALPINTWGTEIAVSNLPERPQGSIYRIVAAHDDTTVQMDSDVLGFLNKGEYIEVGPVDGDHLFQGDMPIFVSQFMTGLTSPGPEIGDPSQGTMIPIAQYVDSYVFSTPPEEQFPTNYVTIIATSADVFGGTILLDSISLSSSIFTQIPMSDYYAAVVPIDAGVHTTSSVFPHGVTVAGYARFDSYLYPGGFLKPIVDENAPTLSIALEPGIASILATDNRASEDTNGDGILSDGEDLNGNGFIDEDTGIFSIELFEADNVALTVIDFLPADPMAEFILQLIDSTRSGSGVIVVIDGAGNNATEVVNLNPIRPRPSKGKCRVPIRGKGKGRSRYPKRSKHRMRRHKSYKMSKKDSSIKIHYIGGDSNPRADRPNGSRARTRGKGSSYKHRMSSMSHKSKKGGQSRVRTRTSRGKGKSDKDQMMSSKKNSKSSKKKSSNQMAMERKRMMGRTRGKDKSGKL